MPPVMENQNILLKKLTMCMNNKYNKRDVYIKF